jgi:hypothetical protein
MQATYIGSCIISLVCNIEHGTHTLSSEDIAL